MENKNKRRALWAGIIAVVAVVTVLVVVLSPPDGSTPMVTPTPTPPFAQHPVPKVSFVVPSKVERNSDFSTTVNISDVFSLWGTQFDIQYNPDIITFKTYSAGAVNGTTPDSLLIYRVGSGPDGEGLIRVLSKWDEYSARNDGFGANGSGFIYKLWFHAGNNSGTTGLSFPTGKGDPPGERKIMRVWNGTVYGLDIKIGTSVVIGQPKKTTPTPTSTAQ